MGRRSAKAKGFERGGASRAAAAGKVFAGGRWVMCSPPALEHERVVEAPGAAARGHGAHGGRLFRALQNEVAVLCRRGRARER